jgi:hypothetical protein
MESAQHLREQAARCRRWASAVTDKEMARRMRELGLEFEARAAALAERRPGVGAAAMMS